MILLGMRLLINMPETREIYRHYFPRMVPDFKRKTELEQPAAIQTFFSGEIIILFARPTVLTEEFCSFLLP